MAVHKNTITAVYLDLTAISKLQNQVDLFRSESFAKDIEAMIETLTKFGIVGITPKHNFKAAINFIQQSGLGKVFEYSEVCNMIWTNTLEPSIIGHLRKQLVV